MMNIERAVLTAALLAAVAASATHSARAELKSRLDRQMGAGSCEPFVPTDGARFNAAGVRNAGASTLYVVCSPAGRGNMSTQEGDINMVVVLTNNSATTRTVTCTARPGSVQGSENLQLASTKSIVVAAGVATSLSWYPSDFLGSNRAALGNPNFTCALEPGVTLNYTFREYLEDVGA